MKEFSTNYTVRTDLAAEARAYCLEKNGKEPDGVICSSRTVDGITVESLEISNEAGEKLVGKPRGKYVTVNVGEFWNSDSSYFDRACKIISDVIRSFIPDGSGLCLFAGLGNRAITADAVGPFAAENFIVTRHIKNSDESLFDSLRLRETACISPGVLAKTGVEGAGIVKSLADEIKPDFIIAVDSLASRSLSRLAATVQVCNTGISPGSGVNNTREELSEKTLGVPVIAVGIPMVVEAATLAHDVVSRAAEQSGSIIDIEHLLANNPSAFFVTPKDADHIARDAAKLIGYAVNLALHDNLTMEEADEFLS